MSLSYQRRRSKRHAMLERSRSLSRVIKDNNCAVVPLSRHLGQLAQSDCCRLQQWDLKYYILKNEDCRDLPPRYVTILQPKRIYKITIIIIVINYWTSV